MVRVRGRVRVRVSVRVGLLGLGEDLEQLVVGEEEESREGEPLLLEVVVEPLLDELEQPVGLLEGTEQALLRRRQQNVGLGDGGEHDLAPQPVDLREALGLRRHLAHDILRREDGLEVEPHALVSGRGGGRARVRARGRARVRVGARVRVAVRC